MLSIDIPDCKIASTDEVSTATQLRAFADRQLSPTVTNLMAGYI